MYRILLVGFRAFDIDSGRSELAVRALTKAYPQEDENPALHGRLHGRAGLFFILCMLLWRKAWAESRGRSHPEPLGAVQQCFMWFIREAKA